MNYKVDAWFRPDSSTDQIKKEISDFELAVGAKVSATSFGKRRLAYKIRGQTEGFFYELNFEGGPEKVSELTTFLSRSQNVLRYLLTRLPMQSSKVKM